MSEPDSELTMDELLSRGPVIIQLAQEQLRNVSVTALSEYGVVVKDDMSFGRFIPWAAIKQIYRKVKS